MSRRSRLSGRRRAPERPGSTAAGRGPGAVTRAVQEGLGTAGEPLDPRARADMEARFARTFDGIRIHADPVAADSARALGAAAYTFGRHIVFGRDRYAPETEAGRRLLAHELAHATQQGGVPPPAAGPVRVSRPHDAAERQAHEAGDAALAGRPVHVTPQPAIVMRDDGSMLDVVRGARADMRRFFASQDRFKHLNGLPMANILAELSAMSAEERTVLVDNFDAAKGGDVPRLRVALQAVVRRGEVGYKEFATLYAADLATLPEDQQRAVLELLGAPAAAPATPSAKPAAPAPAAPGAFPTAHYGMSTKDVTLVRGRERKVTKGKVTPGRSEIKESPEHFTTEILKLAGIDAEAWYNSFTTNVPFLGWRVSDVHTELAAHLKSVEAAFIDKYGGDAKDPATAGKALGLKQHIGGARHEPTGTALSMHLFGLAIDVNYDTNPWVVDEPESQAGKDENAILARATLLVDGKSTSFVPSKMSYEQITALNASIKTYFSYIDDQAALEAKLKTATGSWAGMSGADAHKRVQADFDQLAVFWERNNPKRFSPDVLKAGGFIDLKKELVDGMGLTWGGTYGDMMHFDMRAKGSGARIERARDAYKQKKVAESEETYAAEHPE